MKTDKDIEHLLISSRQLTLSEDERSSIKSTLLARAAETLRQENRPVISPWTAWVLRGSVSFASLLLVFVGTAYAAQDSLPGEPLYVMKIHVVEEMIALTKIAPEDRVAYDSELMETRLVELKILANQEVAPAPEVVAQVSDQIDQHVADVTATIATTENSELSHEKKIATLSNLAAIAKAQSKVVSGEAGFSDITDTTADVEENTSDAISAVVEDFAKEKSVAVVTEYLSHQMDSVSDQITASSTVRETRDAVEDNLHNVDEALVDGAIGDAIVSITEAQKNILVDKYIDDVTGAELEETTD